MAKARNNRVKMDFNDEEEYDEDTGKTDQSTW